MKLLEYSDRTCIEMEGDRLVFKTPPKSRGGRFGFDLKRILKRIKRNNPRLYYDLVSEPEEKGGMGKEAREKMFDAIREYERHRLYAISKNNKKGYMSKWEFMGLLWKNFRRGMFTVDDVLRNIPQPKESTTQTSPYFCKKLELLLRHSYLKRKRIQPEWRDEWCKHARYVYYISPKSCDLFEKIPPEDTPFANKIYLNYNPESKKIVKGINL